MNNKIFCGIDYSIISPAVCIIQNDKIKWISIYSIDAEDHHKLLKKEGSSFKILNESKTILINLCDKPLKQGNTYSETERNKLKSSITAVNFIVELIKKNIEYHKDNEIYIAIEGVSFGASGSSLIDICMQTAILRMKLATDILSSIDNFFVFSPGTIKKFAGGGSFKKNHMYEALISSNETNEFIELLKIYKDNWITKGGMVKPPISDLVDATWIAKLLKEVVNGEQIETMKDEKKKKKKKQKSIKNV